MLSRSLLLASLWLTLATSTFAQTGTTRPVSGAAALGYLATDGNTESTNTNGALELILRPGAWRYRFNLLAIGASSDQGTTAESYSIAQRSERDFSDANYFLALVDWKKDRFSGYKRQLSETIGFGRRLIDNQRHILSMEAGFGAKQATQVDGTDQRDAILRGGLEYLLHLSDTADLSHRVVVESGEENTYTESVSKLTTPIIGSVSLVLSYTIKNNSAVPIDREKRDTFTAIALEYKF